MYYIKFSTFLYKMDDLLNSIKSLSINDNVNEIQSSNNQNIFNNSFLNESKIAELNATFNKCVKGYHLINSSPVNETTWEDINSLVFNELHINIYSQSNGSHSSGMDINSSIGKLSNKSAKYDDINKSYINISSYRLTTICSEKNNGNQSDIVNEINKRKNFDYYSLIVRLEKNDSIEYDWYLIPADYILFNPSSYNWSHTLGKRGKKKDSVIGWNTNKINNSYMSISYSMSSQLWIHIELNNDIKKYIIGNCTCSNKNVYNYIKLYDLYMKECENDESENDESENDESENEESKDEESKDDESKDEESKDEESKDEESKDEESKDEESKKK